MYAVILIVCCEFDFEWTMDYTDLVSQKLEMYSVLQNSGCHEKKKPTHQNKLQIFQESYLKKLVSTYLQIIFSFSMLIVFFSLYNVFLNFFNYSF